MAMIAEKKDDIMIIKITENMDISTINSFEKVCTDVFQEMDNENLKKIIVDLEGLEFISSAGLRGFLMIEKMSREKQTSVVFCSVQEMVMEIFKISCFDIILKIFPTQEEAIQSFGS